MAGKGRSNPIDVHVGSRVRLRRMMVGLSQGRLAERLGITFQQVQKYEKGTNRISASRLQHIARILAMPIPYFFEDVPGTMNEPGPDPKTDDNAAEFLSSGDGFRLNRAFVRIKDSRVRRSIVDLVKALAGEF